jgi:uncharacterized protein
MLSRFSHRQLPRYVYPRKFAHLGVRITADLAVSALSRLCELLANNSAKVAVELIFSTNHQRHCQLTGKAVADLSLVCQRCLTPFTLPIECQLKLMMVSTEQQAANLPDSWEALFIDDAQIDLYQLIEDEFLLALPIVAYHQENCVASSLFSYGNRLDDSNLDDNRTQNDNLENSQKNSPFEVLKGLKAHLK